MAEDEAIGSSGILAKILEKLGEPDKNVSPGSVGGNIDKLRKSSAQLLRDIKAHNIKLLRAINRGNKSSETSAKATVKTTKDKDKKDKKGKDTKKDVAASKETKKSNNALETISNHLKDIKVFLKKQFKKEGLSGSEQRRNNLGLVVDDPKKAKKEKKEKKTSSLPWLSMLFAGGALAGITKVFGMGAGGGVAGGLLAKLLPKIFKVGKAVFKRIPIIGSLFSFYEAYKHFTAGGIDHIIFGLLDVVAGIAYIVPGIGTAIGLGVDVLSYFLQNKAKEHKKEGGGGSFFGSLFDQVTTWLSETPPIVWLTKLGMLAGDLWADPSAETFMAFGEHLGGPLLAFVNFIKNLDMIAGDALGLQNDQGETVGLFEWIYNKVDEYIITPVKDFLTGLFDKIAETVLSLQDKIKGWIAGLVSYLPDFLIPDSVASALGITDDEQKAAQKKAEIDARAKQKGVTDQPFSDVQIDKKIQAKAAKAGMSYEDFVKMDTLITNTPGANIDEGVKTLWYGHKFKEALKLREQLQQQKRPEFEELPLLEETERKYLDKFKEGGTTNNTSVNTNIHNEIQDRSPSSMYDPGLQPNLAT